MRIYGCFLLNTSVLHSKSSQGFAESYVAYLSGFYSKVTDHPLISQCIIQESRANIPLVEKKCRLFNGILSIISTLECMSEMFCSSCSPPPEYVSFYNGNDNDVINRSFLTKAKSDSRLLCKVLVLILTINEISLIC